MSVRTINPLGSTPAQWCNDMSLALAGLGVLPAVRRDEDWRIWAREVVRHTLMGKYTVPSESGYKSWLPWAIDFNKTVVTEL